MIKFTGKLSFDRLQKFASENDCNLSKEHGSIKYSIYDKIGDTANGCKTLPEAKKIIESFIEDRAIESKLTEIIECKDIVETLETVKKNLTWLKAYKKTHKLYISAFNNKFLAISDNGVEYAIATCDFNVDSEFYCVIPIESTIGFCPFMKALRKTDKVNDFTYKLVTEDNGTSLVCKSQDTEFKFNTLPTDVFFITQELQTIVDDFQGNAESIDKKDNKHQEDIDTNNMNNISVKHNLKTTEIKEDMNIQNIDTDNIDNTTRFIHGVGEVDLIPVDSLQVGMYLSYNDILYTVSYIDKAEFINSNSSHIVTVSTLLNATESKKLLLSDSELLAAWAVSFEPQATNLNKTDKTDNKVATNTVDNTDNTELPKPIKPPTNNRGIKGNGRELLIKMLASGATLDQVMKSFNWSKKTASNQMTYVRNWGYNLKHQNNIYKIV